jgi:hypothetical protein
MIGSMGPPPHRLSVVTGPLSVRPTAYTEGVNQGKTHDQSNQARPRLMAQVADLGSARSPERRH